MPIAAFLFDFNGVVIDDEPVHHDAHLATLAPFGIAFTQEEFYGPLLGMPDTEFLKRLLAMRGKQFDEATLAQVQADKNKLYDRLVRERDIEIAGLIDFVHELAQNVPLGIVSGALRPEIEYHLERLGIGDCFQSVVAAGEYPAPKPDPAPYLTGLAALQQATGKVFDPAQVVVIEDSGHGVTSGRAAGMPVIDYIGRSAPEKLIGSFLLVENFTGLTFAGVEQALEESHS